ncbi:MAG: hypothetical protein OQK32_08790 [Gammaproteobacteria bacterium]|nr:hypothetical protein [Gammaproteobacteria bacterium]
MQLCLRAVSTRNPARETKSGILPDLSYQSHMAQQDVKGKGKAKIKVKNKEKLALVVVIT